jgi:hypothetical protein
MYRSLSLSASLGFLLSSFLFACADVTPDDGDNPELSATVDSDRPALAQMEQAIINGTDYEQVVPFLGLARIVGPKLGEIQPFCSGTLITPTIAVTAKHCMTGKPIDQLVVQVGNSSASVASVDLHPRDIATIRLKTPIRSVRADFNRGVLVIDPQRFEGQTVLCMGIGGLDANGNVDRRQNYRAGAWPITIRNPGDHAGFWVDTDPSSNVFFTHSDSGGPCLLMQGHDATQWPLIGLTNAFTAPTAVSELFGTNAYIQALDYL